MSERTLASCETITEITEIPGADAIEAATVRGWTVVVKKGQFSPGDEVLYVEVDAALPLDNPHFAFLRERGVKEFNGREVHVLKTARLRGVYSQGIVFPIHEVFPTPDTAEQQYNVPQTADEILGIKKWEPPLPAGMHALGPFPEFLQKTDAERVQNLDSDTWATIQQNPENWTPLEKIDGMSGTFWKTDDDVLHAAGRNWELDPVGRNAHWQVADHLNLSDLLKPGEWVQGEVAGPGVQGNPLQIDELRLYIFAFGTTDYTRAGTRRSSLEEWPSWVLSHSAPRVPFLELPATIAETVAQVEKMKSTQPPHANAEGVVWTNQHSSTLPGLGDRHVFKSISAAYLLKHDR